MIYHLFILNREANGGMGDYVDSFTHLADAKAHVAAQRRAVWADIAINAPDGRLRRLETYHEAEVDETRDGWKVVSATEKAAT